MCMCLIMGIANKVCVGGGAGETPAGSVIKHVKLHISVPR